MAERSRARLPCVGGVAKVKITPSSFTPYLAMSSTMAMLSLVTSTCFPSGTRGALSESISKFTGKLALA